MNDDLREELAALCHRQWSGWMAHLFSNSVGRADGTTVIPAKLAERWRRQVVTHYKNLSPSEQDADRAEADRILAILKKREQRSA